jgi:hypothetical protein
MLSTVEEIELARKRLGKRDPNSLVALILSLAQDSGPAGEQVRTFIVADDMVEVTECLQRRLRSLKSPSKYQHRHALGEGKGQSCQFILDGIETWVLPREPRRAFALLVEFFESNGRAMEECGEHTHAVECAFERAAAMMVLAAKAMLGEDVAAEASRLMAMDAYGVRRGLRVMVPTGEER